MEGGESNINDRIIQHLWKLRTEESGPFTCLHTFFRRLFGCLHQFLGRDHGDEEGRDLRSSAVQEIIKQ
jgi:ATP sulfurylase